MNWFERVIPPKIRSLMTKPESSENLWVKDPKSGELVFHRELSENQWVVPTSGYHMKIKVQDRLSFFLDDGAYKPIAFASAVADPLRFRDTRRYADRLKEARTKTGLIDAVLPVEGKLLGLPVVVIAQESDFILGSLGATAGAALIAGFEYAVEHRTPVILFAASGGARMQEGVISLMQMARVTVAVSRLKERGLPYIVVLTNPTTGGVSASYAMLGDIHIGEPGALIGFAGARVIEQTVREKLPAGFQRSEFLLEHGMLDMVLARQQLRPEIGRLLRTLTKAVPPAADMVAGRSVGRADLITVEGGDDAVLP